MEKQKKRYNKKIILKCVNRIINKTSYKKIRLKSAKSHPYYNLMMICGLKSFLKGVKIKIYLNLC